MLSNVSVQHAATHAVIPTVWASDGSLGTGTNESVLLLAGFGLDLRPNGDSVKAVSSSQTCEDDPIAEATDLGPGDMEHALNAEAVLLFPASGSYYLCYKPARGRYEQLGLQLAQVKPSSRAVQQTVSFSSLSTCGNRDPIAIILFHTPAPSGPYPIQHVCTPTCRRLVTGQCCCA